MVGKYSSRRKRAVGSREEPGLLFCKNLTFKELKKNLTPSKDSTAGDLIPLNWVSVHTFVLSPWEANFQHALGGQIPFETTAGGGYYVPTSLLQFMSNLLAQQVSCVSLTPTLSVSLTASCPVATGLCSSPPFFLLPADLSRPNPAWVLRPDPSLLHLFMTKATSFQQCWEVSPFPHEPGDHLQPSDLACEMSSGTGHITATLVREFCLSFEPHFFLLGCRNAN